MQTETTGNLQIPSTRTAALALLGSGVALGLSLTWLSGGGLLRVAALALTAGCSAATFAAAGARTRPSRQRRRAADFETSEVETDLGDDLPQRVPVRWQLGHSGDVVPLSFWDAKRERWRKPRDLREWIALHRGISDHLGADRPEAPYA